MGEALLGRMVPLRLQESACSVFGAYILRNSEGVHPFIILNMRMNADMLVKPLAIATSVTDKDISVRDRSARVILFWFRYL